MSALENFAQDVATKTCEIEAKAFDPMLIVAIITAIVNVIQNCRNTPTLATAHSPGLWERWALKKAIKKSLDDPKMERDYFKGIFQAVLEKGATLTEADFQEILFEVQLEAGLL